MATRVIFYGPDNLNDGRESIRTWNSIQWLREGRGAVVTKLCAGITMVAVAPHLFALVVETTDERKEMVYESK